MDCDDGQIVVTITDTGNGIPEDQLELIGRPVVSSKPY
jgi:signal transduction histidine kinase